ncbi:right-handed parallel beta-helix repeat-containing protein [Massilia sp. Se16.2.3]|uniref:right-handed parallel beta-helix repeat-containing protein n=1 Tax=Massilia sp. Se16.2.3 TaxID=2709303 RepID=UPI001E63A511|nr:right-handed parallel beta-helix repeat-containing protein [Massilia sp. Se16.2.3]
MLCEARLAGQPGQRVGISFGGGGTGKRYCRDGRCITEHDGGTLRANLVAGCSDVGIYLNSAANTRIVDNTLLDTAGVQVRFPTSSATVDGNLVDGPIRSDDGGSVHPGDNLASAIAWLYVGRHPQRDLFFAPGRLDLRWHAGAPRRAAAPGSTDLCGGLRGAEASHGAFDDFRACLRAE